nr:hypothetical protein [uncultured Dyadobacter sp.]
MKTSKLETKVYTLTVLVFLTVAFVRCGKKTDQSYTSTLESPIDSVPIEVPKTTEDNQVTSEGESKKSTPTFKLPSDIDRQLFVVAFYDHRFDTPVAIAYNDSRRKRATLFTYNSDGSVSTSKLVAESEMSFREIFECCPEDKPHWEVYPAIVKYVHTNGSIGATFDVLEVE